MDRLRPANSRLDKATLMKLSGKKRRRSILHWRACIRGTALGRRGGRNNGCGDVATYVCKNRDVCYDFRPTGAVIWGLA